MAVARQEDFSRGQTDIAAIAKALSHPARVAILKKLAERKECICGDLVLDLPLAQSTVSQHLKALKEVGIVQGTIDGPRSRYCIDWKVFDRYMKQLQTWGAAMTELKKSNCC